MDEFNPKEEPVCYITDNVTGLKFHNIRRIIEGGICTGITLMIVHKIPFVPKVEIIVSIVMGAAVFLINIIGYKNQSLTEVMMNAIYEKMMDKEYHMRCINDEDKEEQSNQKYGTANQSIADKIANRIKQKYEDYRSENK